MNSPMLNIKQKEIADLIKSNGFKKKEFEFKAIDNDKFHLRLRNSSYRFSIDKNTFMSPGLNGQLSSSFIIKEWKSNLTYVDTWLKILFKELEVGDPWTDEDDYHFYQEINEEHQDAESNFTETEIKDIAAGLAELKKYFLSNTTHTQGQLDAIQADINRLETNSSKISAKDWYLLFIGLLLSWVVGGLLRPDQPKAIFSKLSDFVTNGVNSIVNLLD